MFEVHKESEASSKLFYRIGTLDSVNKRIQWSSPHYYDNGFYPGFTTDGNTIVAIHQARSNRRYYYRIGMIDAIQQKVIWLD